MPQCGLPRINKSIMCNILILNPKLVVHYFPQMLMLLGIPPFGFPSLNRWMRYVYGRASAPLRDFNALLLFLSVISFSAASKFLLNRANAATTSPLSNRLSSYVPRYNSSAPCVARSSTIVRFMATVWGFGIRSQKIFSAAKTNSNHGKLKKTVG